MKKRLYEGVRKGNFLLGKEMMRFGGRKGEGTVCNSYKECNVDAVGDTRSQVRPSTNGPRPAKRGG